MKFVGNTTPNYPSALNPTNPEDITDKAYCDAQGVTRVKLGANVTGISAITSYLTYTVPANSVSIGDTFRIKTTGFQIAAGNPSFLAGVGSSSPGTTQAWTSGALSASGAAGCWCEILLTVKATGASGSVTGGGFALASTSQGATTSIPTVTIDTTATWYISARASTSASTLTVVSCVIEKL